MHDAGDGRNFRSPGAGQSGTPMPGTQSCTNRWASLFHRWVRPVVAGGLLVVGLHAGVWAGGDELIFQDRFATLPGEPDRPSGMVAKVEQGDPLDVTPARRHAARSAYEELDHSELASGFDPQDLYAVFNEFAITHFGAVNQFHVAAHDGDVLDFDPDASWEYASRNSATVAFGTNAPVTGHVEYGASPAALNNQTSPGERFYNLQIHHLTGLEPETTYYFRRVARGADGETIISHVESFETRSGEGAVPVPGKLAGPPYILDQPGTEYLLTEDIVADGTALHVAASNITIDLNGYSVVHANDLIEDANGNNIDTAGAGIWGQSPDLSDIRIFNGRIREGYVGNSASTSVSGLHSIYLSGVENIDVAGVSVDYHGAQIHSVVLRYPAGSIRLHHNSFRDSGFEILDRHGSGGGRPLRISDTSENNSSPNDYVLRHNLVRRTRQNGFMRASLMHDNEIYVDSWSTNSFAIQPQSTVDTPAGEFHHNRIYLSGYNAYGFGWAHLDLLVRNNLIQMEGVVTDDRRFAESWGERDTISAFRITNYGAGGQVRHNLVYRDNLVVGRARGPGRMRGTMFYSDTTISDTQFQGNVVIVEAEDDDPEMIEATPIVAQGVSATRHDHLPTFYRDNLLVSNVANVRFGDDYGRGSHHTLIGPRLARTGDHPDYHTIVFDGGFDTRGHRLIDPVVEGGAAYDDVWWKRTSNQSAYMIGWTLTVLGTPGAGVHISDNEGETVLSGELDGEGVLSVALDVMTIRPADWDPDNPHQVGDVYNHQKIHHTPHTVTVGSESMKVTLEAPETIQF